MNYKVFTICFTYNHSSFIVDTMKGFVCQKTNFPYLCCILDDASTDNEDEVILKYMNNEFEPVCASKSLCETRDYGRLLFGRHKNNRNCFFYVILLNENHFSKGKDGLIYTSDIMGNCDYGAFCEGDDYWTDINKLQEQADFLDEHSDYSLCFHAHMNLYNDGTSKTKRRYVTDRYDCPIEEMIKEGGGYMATCSMFFRMRSFLGNKPSWHRESPVGDYVNMLWLASHGKVYYCSKVMSTYRAMSSGSWNERLQKKWRMRKDYYDKSIRTLKGFNEWSNNNYKAAVVHRINHLRRSRFVSLYYHPVKLYILSFFRK